MTNAPLSDGLPPLRDVIKHYDLTAKKALGQNFLLDLNITRKIARACGDLRDQTVVEVGPGPGGLTRALLLEGAGKVVAVERDGRCLPALNEIASAYQDRLEVTHGDALEIDWLSLIGQNEKRATIAANLPYAVASLLLVGWLETEPWPPWYQRMVLMFQREVAERIVAAPGSKAYGRLSVLAQWRCETRMAMTLPAEAFTPPPKVDSAVVVFDPRPRPLPQVSVKTLARITQAAFGQRRKMLRASLKQITPLPELLLAKAGIAPEKRPEQLSVGEFATLAAAFEGSP